MSPSLTRSFVAGISALLLPAVLFAADAAPFPTAPSVRVQLAAVDPALRRLTTAALIDRLQEESQYVVQESHGASHIAQPAFYAATFLPVQSPQRSDPRSPVMTELVARGISALPLLLDHLSDPRPTKLSFAGPKLGERYLGGLMEFRDDYSPRYEEVFLFGEKIPGRETKTTNLGKKRQLAVGMVHTVAVGDLCYVTVSQIVNRRALGSPQLFPGIIEATRADWSGLTPQEHELSLRNDAFRLTSEGRAGKYALEAVPRLLFYYPDSGRQVVETLLKRRLINPLAPCSPQDWEEVNMIQQDQLIAVLEVVQWAGWEKAVYSVYQNALAQESSVYRDQLALRCACKLRGHGYDREFVKFLSETIARNEVAKGEVIDGVRWPGLGNLTAHFKTVLSEFNTRPNGG